MQILGLILAFVGLLIFLLPAIDFNDFPNLASGAASGSASGSSLGYFMMIGAGIAWGLYSWNGRSSKDASLSTARNFIGAATLVLLLFPFADSITAYGLLLGAASGIITSAMGYVIWYAVLPHISVSTAATAQLSVPAIAAIGGILFLGEAISMTFLLGSALIFVGIGLTIWKKG